MNDGNGNDMGEIEKECRFYKGIEECWGRWESQGGETVRFCSCWIFPSIISCSRFPEGHYTC